MFDAEYCLTHDITHHTLITDPPCTCSAVSMQQLSYLLPSVNVSLSAQVHSVVVSVTVVVVIGSTQQKISPNKCSLLHVCRKLYKMLLSFIFGSHTIQYLSRPIDPRREKNISGLVVERTHKTDADFAHSSPKFYRAKCKSAKVQNSASTFDLNRLRALWFQNRATY